MSRLRCLAGLCDPMNTQDDWSGGKRRQKQQVKVTKLTMRLDKIEMSRREKRRGIGSGGGGYGDDYFGKAAPTGRCRGRPRPRPRAPSWRRARQAKRDDAATSRVILILVAILEGEDTRTRSSQWPLARARASCPSNCVLAGGSWKWLARAVVASGV